MREFVDDEWVVQFREGTGGRHARSWRLAADSERDARDFLETIGFSLITPWDYCRSSVDGPLWAEVYARSERSAA